MIAADLFQGDGRFGASHAVCRQSTGRPSRFVKATPTNWLPKVKEL
jgi:hypothetical protein